MKTGKRALVAAVAVTMCFTGFALTGCGSKDTSTAADVLQQKPVDTAEQDIAETAEAPEPIERQDEKTETTQPQENTAKTTEAKKVEAKKTDAKKNEAKNTKASAESDESSVLVRMPQNVSDSEPIEEMVDNIDCSASWEYTTEYYDAEEQYSREATVRGSGSIKYVNSEKFEANGRAIVVVHFSEDVENNYMKNPDGSDVKDELFIDDHKFRTSIWMGERSQTVVNKDTGETDYMDIKDPNLNNLEEELFVPMKEWMIAEGAEEEFFCKGSLALSNEPGWTVNFGNNFDSNGHAENFCFYELKRADAGVTVGIEIKSPLDGVSVTDLTPAKESTQTMTLTF